MKVIKGFDELNNRSVMFVTTKNLDYIRNSQEIRLLQSVTKDLHVIGSGSMSYPIRLIKVWCTLLFISFKQYDAVFVGFVPQLIMPLFGKRMKHLGCEIYEDFFVSLYDTMCCDRRKFRPDSVIGKWMHRIDARTLSLADKVICDTKAHTEYFAREFGTIEESLKESGMSCNGQNDMYEVLYLEADREIYKVRRLDRAQTIKDLGLDSISKSKIVIYFGSILPLQGADVVYEAMTKLTAVGGYICVFVGSIKNLNSSLFCKDIYHIDWLKQLDLAALIEVADICLAGHFNADIDKAKRTIPGKAYIYEAMGKKMILGDNSANREFFIEDSRHIFVPMSDADAIVDAVCKATEHGL